MFGPSFPRDGATRKVQNATGTGSRFARRVQALLWLATAFLCMSSSSLRAFAQVTEPNGLMIPQPASGSETGIVQGRGFPPASVTLDGLFQFRSETLSAARDARTAPAVFSPLCGFTATLVLRGGGCRVDFGWYNATRSGGTPPPDSEIYTLISRDDPQVYNCANPQDFCPLAFNGATPPPGQPVWTLKTLPSGNIRNDPTGRYKGGLVGFALRGNPTSCCQMTKFSQPELNQRCTTCTGMAPWINALIYQSTATPDAFYMAFEDLPTSPTAFSAPTDTSSGTCPGVFANDGDFNDFVFFVTGITCAGGGQACDAGVLDTNIKGACRVGRTDCSPDGQGTVCRPVVKPGAERCDNIDNDCNGTVDDGTGLCEARKVCNNGQCVAACDAGEFTCPGNFACVSGLCVDVRCQNKPCAEGQACRAGVCVGACDGVRCPTNQECQLGRCVDLCAGVICPDTQVCDKGVCVSSCQCRECATGFNCADSGRCVDPGCEKLTCEAGKVCVMGACVAACDNARCPGGAACVAGVCGEPPLGADPGGGGAPGGGTSGGVIVISSGGSGTGTSGSFGSGADTGDGTRATSKEAGCGCRIVTGENTRGPLLLSVLTFVAFLWRASRRGRDAVVQDE